MENDTKDLISRIQNLNLPKGQYMVCGSAIMQVLGIRQAQDIDLLVTPELFAKLEEEGWRPNEKYPTTIDSPGGEAGAKKSMDFMVQNYTLDEMITSAYWFEGIPFTSLGMLIDAKTQMGREKDLRDLELIKAYQDK